MAFRPTKNFAAFQTLLAYLTCMIGGLLALPALAGPKPSNIFIDPNLPDTCAKIYLLKSAEVLAPGHYKQLEALARALDESGLIDRTNALAALSGEEGLVILEKIIRTDPRIELQTAALRRLSELAMNRPYRAARNKDAARASAYLFGLESANFVRWSGSRWLDYVEELASSTKLPSVRADANAIMHRELSSEQPWMRESATRAVTRMYATKPDKLKRDAVTELVFHSSYPEVRSQGIRVIAVDSHYLKNADGATRRWLFDQLTELKIDTDSGVRFWAESGLRSLEKSLK